MSWTAWRVQAGAKLTQPNELQSTRVVCFMAGEPGPPLNVPLRNKGLIRPYYYGKPMVNKLLIRPYFCGRAVC